MRKNYFRELSELFSKIMVAGSSGKPLSFNRATSKIINSIKALDKKKNKIIFIGNGGSAAIANHISTDFLKNAEIPALAFSDSSLITCISNDLGYERVFEKPIELLAQKGDILFSISSSGSSRNILNATSMAKSKGCFLVTLSGFDKDNPLRKLGNLNFYIPSHSYGFVEIGHLAICHAIVDKITEG